MDFYVNKMRQIQVALVLNTHKGQQQEIFDLAVGAADVDPVAGSNRGKQYAKLYSIVHLRRTSAEQIVNKQVKLTFGGN